MRRPLELGAIQEAMDAAEFVLIATDFDGTICSLGDRPESVQMPARTALALQRIAASPKAILCILSGRSVADLRQRLPIAGDEAILAGNEGLEIAGRDFNFAHPEAERLTFRLAHVCESVEQAILPWPGAWVERKRLSATVHVRACPVDDWLSIRDAVRSVVRPVDDVFALAAGRAAYEISPRIGWDKGSAIKYIARQLALENVLTLCIGAGDSDEPMFRAVTEGVTIRMGPLVDSEAMYSIPNASAVADLLEWLALTLEESPRRVTFSRLARGGLVRTSR